ncbi:MAG TPA: hypothetical protein VGO55_05705 [Allosphingosinicella sp.]|jgi:hypothetical protein|nr:hypothetical protein [Allosphingosinicella sp.]
MSDPNWFEEVFGTLGDAVAEVRHELLGGWFGRTFEPHPMQRQGLDHEQPSPGERDIHGNERGIDR